MSVAKTGSDDHNCGLTNHDPMHRAICRLVASGVTVVAAAGNNHFSASRLVPASYNEVITVSALADSDGRPGGLGGNALLLVGELRPRRHVRELQQLRPGRRPHRAGQVHLVERARRLRVPLGDLDGGAARDRRGRALKASRPLATPAQVQQALVAAGNLDWKVGPIPTAPTSRCSTSSQHRPPRRLRARGGPAPTGAIGPAVARARSGSTACARSDVLGDIEPVGQRGLPDVGLAVRPAPDRLQPTRPRSLTLTVPAGTPSGTYRATVTGNVGGLVRTVRIPVVVDTNAPQRRPGHPRRARRDQPQRLEGRGPGNLAGGHRRDLGHRRLPGPMAGRRRRLGRDDRPRVDVDHDRAHVRGRPRVPLPGPHPRRRRELERLDRVRAVHRRASSRTAARRSRRRSTWRRSTSSMCVRRIDPLRASGRARRCRRTFSRPRRSRIVAPFGRNRGSARVCVDGVYRSRSLHLHRRHTHAAPGRVHSTTWATSGTHTIEIRRRRATAGSTWTPSSSSVESPSRSARRIVRARARDPCDDAGPPRRRGPPWHARCGREPSSSGW